MATILDVAGHPNLAPVGHDPVAVSEAGIASPDRAPVPTAGLCVWEGGARPPARAAVVGVGAHLCFAAIRRIAVAVVVVLVADGDVAGVVGVATRCGVSDDTRRAVFIGTADTGKIDADAGLAARLEPRRAAEW